MEGICIKCKKHKFDICPGCKKCWDCIDNNCDADHENDGVENV